MPAPLDLASGKYCRVLPIEHSQIHDSLPGGFTPMKTIRATHLAIVTAVLWLCAALSFVGLAPSAHAQARPAPLRVLASNAVKSVMDELRPQCEKAIGRSLLLQYETSKNLGKSITGG